MTRLDTTALGDFIREQRVAARVSLRQLAQATGVSNPYLSQVERGLRRPSAEILNRIATGLRISAETLYVRAGILAERAGNADVVAAIVADDTITERQRQVLLDIYSTFHLENAASAETAQAAAHAGVEESQAPPGPSAGIAGHPALTEQAGEH